MPSLYSFKMCNNLKKYLPRKAISEKKNTLYICKTGKTKNKMVKHNSKEKAGKLRTL